MDEKQKKDRQSGYDESTFGPVNRDPYQRDSLGQGAHHDSYNYSQKYNGQQGAFNQQKSGQSYAQHAQTPPDGGAFYHSGEPPRGMGFGIASMVLGIVAIVLSCSCINLPLAVIAVIFGIIHICRGTGSNGYAIAGIVTAIISVVLTIVLTVVLYMIGASTELPLYDRYFPFEYNDYDDYDDYDYDGQDDFFKGKEYEGVDI